MMLSHAEIRQPLLDRFGQPEKFDTAAALRMLSKRDEVHPRSAVAFIYPSWEAADAFGKANAEHWGHGDLGRMVVEGGVLGVTDLRPQFRAMGAKVTDPALPDDWKP